MHVTGLVVALVVCVLGVVLGSRFLLAPRQATLDYGVAEDNVRALTAIKGVREITTGVLILVVWLAAGRTAMGWTLIALAFTPTSDAVIVLTNGGKRLTAFGVHGLTAAVFVGVGTLLVVA